MKIEYINKLNKINTFNDNCLQVTYNDLQKLLELPSIKCINRIKLKYICKVCNEYSLTRFDTFKIHPFVCKKCYAKEVFSNEELKQRIKETNIKNNGGVGFDSEKVYNKYKETMLNKTGKVLKNYCDYTKMLETKRKKYGEHLETLTDKIKKTKKEKYNDENYNNKQKMFSTNKIKYGNKCSLNGVSIREKREQTWVDRYGTKHPWSNKEIHQKCVETTFNIFGRINVFSKYRYDNETFDSSWELAFYIYLKEHNIRFNYHNEKISYVFNNEQHLYFPDFRVFNTIVEIKSPYLYSKMLKENTIENAKLQCMQENNVKIITNCDFYLNYVENKYGKDFIDNCKIINKVKG